MRRSLAISVLIYGLLTAACTVLAVWLVFAGWAGYDDEGFFDYSLKTFVAGHSLYSSVYSEYGPFFYLLFGAFFKVTGLAVTTQAGRTITVFSWVASSLGLGVATQCFTRSLGAGLVAFLAAFTLLSVLAGDPMHAQVLVMMLVTVIAALSMTALVRSDRVAPFALGAAVMALMLTKVNIGGYMAIAFAYAFVTTSSTWLRRKTAICLAATGFVLIGPALMNSEWHVHQQLMYAISIALAGSGLAVTAWPSRSEREPGFVAETLLLWWIAGFLACGALILLTMLVLGGSLGAWIEQTIVTPTHQAKFLQISLDISAKEAVLGGVGAACAVLARLLPRFLGRRLGTWSPLITGLGRLAVGLLIVLPAASLFPFKALSYPYMYAWPVVWVAAVPPGSTADARERFVRVLLVSMAIMLSLMAYPVAGSQVTLGGLLFPICGAICLADGVRDFGDWSKVRWRGSRVPSALAAGVVMIIAAWICDSNVVRNFGPFHAGYEASAPLHVRGASGVRLAPDLAHDIDSVVATINGLHCRTLLEVPGQYSLNLWTGLDTPNPLTGQQPYWESLTPSQQEELLDSVRTARRMCLIWDNAEIGFYIGTQPLPHLPLLTYLRTKFVTVETIGSWRIEVRKGHVI